MRSGTPLLAAIAIGLAASAAVSAEPAAVEPCISIQTPTGEISLRPSIVVDDQPLAQRWNAYLRALFDLLDRNGDDSLDQAEAARVPLPEFLRNQWHADFDNVPEGIVASKELDRDPADGRVKRQELAGYYHRAGCGLLEVQSRESRQTWHEAEARWLFDQLASDDAIDARSVAGAYDRMRAADDDERLSEAELRAVCRAATASTGSKSSSPDFARLTDEQPGDAIGVALRLAISSKNGGKFEGHSGRLVDLVAHRQGGKLVRLVTAPGSGAADYDSARLALVQQFETDDLDSDGVSNASEIQQSPMQACFAQILRIADVNSDGRLAAGELQRYLDLQGQAARSAVLVTIVDLGRPLFEQLDIDGDRSLSQRELRHGWDRLRSWDGNENGHLAYEEIPRQYELTWSLGRPTLAPASSPPAPIDETSPHWFRSMDRNRDGDVSRREFLGTRDDFERLDADSDQLISPAEARAD